MLLGIHKTAVARSTEAALYPTVCRGDDEMIHKERYQSSKKITKERDSNAHKKSYIFFFSRVGSLKLMFSFLNDA